MWCGVLVPGPSFPQLVVSSAGPRLTAMTPFLPFHWPALSGGGPGSSEHLPGLLGASVLPGPLSSYIGPAGIEDKESWHGKPLPKNMAEQIIQEIHSQIQSKKKILATPPQEDAPSVDITNIRMPTPPSYKVGDKVKSGLAFLD